jgi:hypothetical protein
LAEFILVKNGDIYVAGQDGSNAVYWKNGVMVKLTDGKESSRAYSIAINGNDIYVSGYENVRVNGSAIRVAKYWKNGVDVTLKEGSVAYSITILNNDVYVVGEDGRSGTYWKNGNKVSLDNGTPTFITTSKNQIYAVGSRAPTSSMTTAILWSITENDSGWADEIKISNPNYSFSSASSIFIK